LAAGLVGGLLAPLVYPALARNARPGTKRMLKLGLAALERGRVAAAELGEHAGDLLAEARAEYEEERKPYSVAPETAAQAEMEKEVISLRGSGREAVGS
jgi:hypothetical protein